MSFNGVGQKAFIEGNMKAKKHIEILRNDLCNSDSEIRDF